MASSLVYGPKKPALCTKPLGTIIDEQVSHFGDRSAVIVPWQSVRLSYRQLADRSRILSKAMLATGWLQRGDCIGIMAGNRYEYIEIFLGAARIGCPVVVLNNMYTPAELENAVRTSSCKIVFISPAIGTRSLQGHIQRLCAKDGRGPALPELQKVVSLGEVTDTESQIKLYRAFVSKGQSEVDGALCERAENAVTPDDILNLQFTSGTTGSPKAAMLTHINLINNAQFVGHAMRLVPNDIICCPPPLFHCFGLVMGFLASFYHGSTIVFPSDHFHAPSVVDSILRENVTVLLGVPTMFVAELEVLSKRSAEGRGQGQPQRPHRIRTGLAAGSVVPEALMSQLRDRMGVDKMLIAYGMTETSPVTFITDIGDPDDKRTGTIGKVMPHTAAKVIGKDGSILPRGQRGELCTSGYALQRGYWRKEETMREVMKRDEDGVLWMHTGDEVLIDEEGYGHVTGRIKDIIIRGGENIYPREIEDRLICHPFVSEASVVGLHDAKYGEAVACFLKASQGCSRLTDDEVRQWVGERLGRHKAPRHIFWIGDRAIGDDFPKTGSGKHQKHIMRDLGNRLIKGARAKL